MYTSTCVKHSRNLRKKNILVELLKKENQECARPYSNLIPFFCGSSKTCLKRNDAALELAKQNVREKYIIVGIRVENVVIIYNI